MKKPVLFAAFLCGCLLALPSAVMAAKAPGFKFDGGKVKVDPTVSVSAYWDSNINGTYSHEESGWGWRITPALSLSYNTQRTTLSSKMFYTCQRAGDSDNEGDRDSYGISFVLLHQFSERLRLTLNGSYTHTEDDDFYWIDEAGSVGSLDKDKTETYNVNAGLGYTAKRWHASAGVGWRRTDYDDYDNTSDAFSVHGKWGKSISEHAYWDFSLGATMNSPCHGDDSIAYSAMTGVSGKASSRTTYSAMVGVMMYDYSGYKDDTDVSPKYNVSGSYRLSRKVTLSLAMGSYYDSESYGSAKHYYIIRHNLSAAANIQWTDVISSRLDLSCIYEQHECPTSSSYEYDRTYYRLRASTYYKFNDYATMFGAVSYSMDEYDYSSSSSRDKDNVRCEVGLSFRF